MAGDTVQSDWTDGAEVRVIEQSDWTNELRVYDIQKMILQTHSRQEMD